VAGCGECSDEPPGPGAAEFVEATPKRRGFK
jgi:hypothetical protein